MTSSYEFKRGTQKVNGNDGENLFGKKNSDVQFD